MQAVQYSQFSKDGEPSPLKMVTVPKPVLSHPSSALIKVYAASINPIDVYVVKGMLAQRGWPCPLPGSPGMDFSGIIESLSDDVTDFHVGDEVFGCHGGSPTSGTHVDENGSVASTFAEYFVVPINQVVKKPPALSHVQAAAIALVGMTANGPLGLANVGPSSKVLVLGGSTAVGTLVIQLAKLKGAWVATTASTRAIEYVSQFGADQIVDYTQTKWWETTESGLSGLDVVFDASREENLLERAKTEGVVKEGGKIVSVCTHSLGFNPAAYQPRFSFCAFVSVRPIYSAQDMAQLAQWIADGTVKLPVENVFPFTQQGVLDIFAKSESGKSLGKQVLQIMA
eukprot:gene30085-37244_t